MPRNPNKISYLGSFQASFDIFASITDPRDGCHTLHHFGEILFIAFAAIFCELRLNELMDEFAESREDLVRKWLKISTCIPSYKTFSRVFQAFEPTVFASCIDDKTLRGSRSEETTHLHAVSA